MRYTVIQIFDEDEEIFQHTTGKRFFLSMLNKSKDLKEFFKIHKYIVMLYRHNNFMLLREDHPLFNVGVITSKMVIGNKTSLYSHKSVERDIVMLVNNLLEDFNAKN